MLGKEVAILVNENKAPGRYSVTFDGSNLPSGIYFYRIAIHSDRLDAGNFIQVKKMMMVK